MKFNTSYIGQRPDIASLLLSDAKDILDIGCSTGKFGAAVKSERNARVVGIEISKDMAAVAKEYLDNVFVGDAVDILTDRNFQSAYLHAFDTIIFGDILEHLADPWLALQSAVQLLKPDGVIIASIPNVRHIDTIFHLLIKGYWPYRDRGIHDQAHLRFFTKKNIMELFTKEGLAIEKIVVNYRLLERPHKINRYAKFFAFPGVRNFIAFQYVLRARLRE